MGNKRAKILGIVVILVAFFIISFNSLRITSPSVLDTDPSTYIIVVMLMLFVFIIFSAKEDIDFEYSRTNLICSSTIFLVYILLLSYLRVSLSSAFLSYRIDSLLFPLPLLSLIVLIFGFDGAKKLSPLIIFSLFASPVILIPLLNLNTAFANLNAIGVYDVMRVMGLQVSRLGLVISSGIGPSITISGTCVSIGTFIALIMFMIPVAYFYEGKLKDKLDWIATGTLLILALNFFRMLLIAIIWVFYGFSEALNVFHLFVGQLLFYFVIILMVLISYKYNLDIVRINKKTMKDIRSFYSVKEKGVYTIVIAAIILAAIGFAINLGYSRNLYAPAIHFGENPEVNNATLSQQALEGVENSGGNIAVLANSGTNYLYLLGNLTGNQNESVFAIANISYSALPKPNLPGYVPVGGPHSYLLKNGVAITAQTAYSGNGLFEFNYFSLPYNLSGSWLMVNYIVFQRVNNSVVSCSRINQGSIGTLDYFISELHNAISLQKTTDIGFICNAYLIASSR